MNQVFRSAGVVVLGVGFYAWSSMQSGQNFERVVAHYDLNPSQAAFVESCMSSLDYYDKKFKGGAKSHTGCGCIASTLLKTDPDTDFIKMGQAFTSVVKFSETDSSKEMDAVGLMQDLTQNQRLSYAETMTVVGELGAATETCKSAKLPRQTQGMASTSQQAAMTSRSSKKGCEGLSADSVATLQKIADRDGTTLEQMCESVVR